MKKSIFLLAILSVFMIGTVTAQKPFSGTIVMKTEIVGLENPEEIAQNSPDITYTILGNLSKAVVLQEGASITEIVNGDKKVVYVVIEVTGMGKFYIEATTEEIEKKLKFTEYNYEYSDETMEIAGYKAQKVIVKTIDLETDEEGTMVLYVSKEINSGDLLNFSDYPGLEGFPLRTEVELGAEYPGAKTIIEAKEIKPSKKIKSYEFLLPSDAKNIKEDPDLMKMFGMNPDE